MTVIVGGVIVASVGLFLRMLVIESRRTCKKRASPPSGNVSGGGGGGGGGEGSGGSSGGGATGSSPLHLRARVARMSAFASSTRGKLTGHLASSSGMAPNAEVLSERFGAPRSGPPGAVDATTSTMRMQLNPLAALMDRRRASAALPNAATQSRDGLHSSRRDLPCGTAPSSPCLPCSLPPSCAGKEANPLHAI